MCSFLNELKDLSVGDFIRINKKDQISMLGHDPAVHWMVTPLNVWLYSNLIEISQNRGMIDWL